MQLIFTETINKKPSFFVEKISNSLLLGMNEYLKYLDLYEQKFNKKWDGALSTAKPKKHSIREDKPNRWKVGNKIHFVINPYNKNRFQFAPVLLVKGIQEIEIRNIFCDEDGVSIDGRELNKEEIEELAINDGFDSVGAFWGYFKEQDFKGKIIHWTDLTY